MCGRGSIIDISPRNATENQSLSKAVVSLHKGNNKGKQFTTGIQNVFI
jgi:hypothetical protein